MTKNTHDDDEFEMDVAGNGKPALEHPSYEELEAQLTAAENRATENWEKLLRLQADFDNQVKRHERDLAQAHKFATESVFRALIDIADNLERALEHTASGEDAAALHTGVELTLKLLQNLFTKFSITVVNPIGEPFDPSLHEAMSMQEDPSKKPGTVLAVLQKGYQLHDRLLRPAMVMVAKAPGN